VVLHAQPPGRPASQASGNSGLLTLVSRKP
jgi:hypothetical protein